MWLGYVRLPILWNHICQKLIELSLYPDRVDEGYGLSVKGIDNVLEKVFRNKNYYYCR